MAVGGYACFYIILVEKLGLMMENNSFKMGLRDGVAIGVGYLAVGFAFGLSSAIAGLSALEAFFISLFNLTSAGQLAGMPIIATGGSYIEMAMTQLVINSRYALMSVSLSQKLGKSVRFIDRFLIGFANTDEIFAVACGKGAPLGRKYMFGLMIAPIAGWCGGTLLGAIAGDILPEVVVTALSVSMYAMFIAIIVPAMRSSLRTALSVITAVALSSVFYFVPALGVIPAGFVIIIVAVFVSSLFAIVAPVRDESDEGDSSGACGENGGNSTAISPNDDGGEAVI